MGTKHFDSELLFELVLEQCNSIWVQNAKGGQMCNPIVLEQCNSIWVQNLAGTYDDTLYVLEQCNSIWVQNHSNGVHG